VSVKFPKDADVPDAVEIDPSDVKLPVAAVDCVVASGNVINPPADRVTFPAVTSPVVVKFDDVKVPLAAMDVVLAPLL